MLQNIKCTHLSCSLTECQELLWFTDIEVSVHCGVEDMVKQSSLYHGDEAGREQGQYAPQEPASVTYFLELGINT